MFVLDRTIGATFQALAYFVEFKIGMKTVITLLRLGKDRTDAAGDTPGGVFDRNGEI